MVLALGALVNFGLNADFSQQATMRSFRQSLMSASESTQNGKASSVSYLRIDDRHIPSPSSPFGIGSVSPVGGEGGSITRNFHTQEVGTAVEELPRIAVEIKGSTCPGSRLSPAGSDPPCFYLTAGFRTEDDAPPGSIKRYAEVYGSSSVCDKPECGGECLNRDSKSKECKNVKKLKIIDPCEGEILGYDGCIQQARLIVDSEVCTTLCEKKKLPGNLIDCQAVCSEPMNVPWYAQDASKDSEGVWTFPRLNTLFSGIKALGLQSGYVKTTTMDTSLEKADCVRDLQTDRCVDEQEDEHKKREARATSHVIWRDGATRRLIRAVKPVDYTQDPAHPLIVTPTTQSEDSVTTEAKNENSTTAWTTPSE